MNHSYYWEKHWPDAVAQQEKLLRYSSFTREDALELGLKIIELARQNYNGQISVKITEDDTIVFSHKTSGTSIENEMWMDRKLAVSHQSGTSSLGAYLSAVAGQGRAFWLDRPENFAPCGGCFPVLLADNCRPWAYVAVSGMRHFQDHQVIADAMAWQLNVQIPTIT